MIYTTVIVVRTTMLKLAPAASCAAALLLLSACASTTSDSTGEATAPNVEPATNTSTPEPSEDTERSSRGNQVMSTGEPAALYLEDQENDPVVSFTVKSIEVDPTCTAEFQQPPENGHFLVLDVEVETGTPEQFEEAFYTSDYAYGFYDWKFIGPNGTTANTITSGPALGCYPQDQYLPNSIGPGERATGYIVLDAPSAEGTLVYTDPVSRLGWEWEVAAS